MFDSCHYFTGFLRPRARTNVISLVSAAILLGSHPETPTKQAPEVAVFILFEVLPWLFDPLHHAHCGMVCSGLPSR